MSLLSSYKFSFVLNLFSLLLLISPFPVQPEVESVPAGGSLVVQAGAPVTLKCKVLIVMEILAPVVLVFAMTLALFLFEFC